MMLTVLAAPAGQTCGDYAGAFAEAVGGYLNNPGSEGDCQFCQYRVGDSFYNNLNITYDTRWRDFGIFVSASTDNCGRFDNADHAVVLHCLQYHCPSRSRQVLEMVQAIRGSWPCAVLTSQHHNII
jgi:hypothetical protein